MKKLSLIILIFCYFSTFAQTTKDEVGPSAFEVQLIPESPGVANLGKYGEDPINQYNGTGNINLPLYTLAFEGLNIPFNLNYNTGGIKVNEDASWVGLGWSFLENSIITREINGFDDLRNYETNYGGIEDAESKGWLFTEDLFTFSGHPDYTTEITQQTLDWLAEQYGKNKPIDTQPDLFTLAIPTGSVKFYLPRIVNNAQILEAQVITEKNFIVKYNVSTLTFEVKDPEGFTYIFDQKEYSTGYSSWDAPEATNEQHAMQGISYWSTNQTRMLNSSWKLSKIISYSGRELNFEYEQGFFFSFPNFREKFKFSVGGEPGPGNYNENIDDISITNISASLTAFHTLYLKKISGDFGSVTFQLGERIDLFTKEAKAKMANELVWNPAITPNVNNDKKLEGFQVRNMNGRLVQDVTFNYSYFNREAVNDPLPERFLRLKLDSVSIFDKSYNFGYFNSETMPAKDSKMVDFWGYYNNVNNLFRVPTSNRFYAVLPTNSTSDDVFEKFYKWNGANRKSDFNFGKAGNLYRITYPTGGYSEYAYEGNSVALKVPSYTPQFFSNMDFRHSQINSSEGYNFRYQYLKLAKDTSYSFFQNNTCSVQSSGGIGNNEIFNIDSNNLCNGQNYNLRINATLSCSTGCGQGIDPTGKAVWLENVDTGEETIVFYYDNQFNQTYEPVFLEKELNLTPGNYILRSTNWSVNDPFLVVATVATSAISWYNTASGDTGSLYEEFEVGGIRIAKIFNYEADGSFVSGKRFNYETLFEDGIFRSSGKLMDDLIFTSKGNSFHEYTPEAFEEGNGQNISFIHSDNLLRTSSSAAGSHIGYDRVTTESIDSNSNSNGKIVSKFYNLPNSYFERNIGITPVFTGVGSSVDVSYGDVYLLGTMPFVKPLNGTLLLQNVFDSLGFPVKETVNEYFDYDGAMAPFQRYPILFWTGSVFSTTYPYREVYYTELNKNKVQRIKSTETTEYLENGDFKSLTEYNYNSYHYKAIKISSTDSKGDINIQRNYFPQDLSTEPFMNILLQENRIMPIKTESYVIPSGYTEEERLQTYQRFYNNDPSTSYLTYPKEIKSYKGEDGATGLKLFYEKYDHFGNLLQYIKEAGTSITLIWSYKAMYPVARIENATFAEVASALGKTESELMNLGTTEISSLNNLRTLLPSSLITTYTYEPLVGITSVTDYKGETTRYHYDSHNRLEAVKDSKGNLLKDYKYNLKSILEP